MSEIEIQNNYAAELDAIKGELAKHIAEMADRIGKTILAEHKILLQKFGRLEEIRYRCDLAFCFLDSCFYTDWFGGHGEKIKDQKYFNIEYKV